LKTQKPDFAKLGSGRKSLKTLLKRMLEKDPDKRIGIYDLLNDPWVTDNGSAKVDLDILSSYSD
jgi:hypothetical protein